MGMRLGLFFALLGVVLAGSVLAAPGIPNKLYGNVSVNGVLVPDGTAVQTRIGEDVYITTTLNGRFGYAPVFFVEDPDGNRAGKDIEIFVNYKKIQDLVFQNGGGAFLALETTTSCGDGYCLGSETSSACPGDCGALPINQGNTGNSGSSSSGGGPSGGSGSSNTQARTAPINTSICIEQWECSDWSECKDGKQKRLCRDNNSCKTAKLKPDEIRDCESRGGELKESAETKQTQHGIFGAVTGIVSSSGGKIALGFVVLVVVIAIGFMIARKRKK